jgi:hypothetical protein
MFDVAPEEVRAVVVGVDHYGYGAPWTLNGPAADALRTVDWLRTQGVLPKHITLFLSPTSWSEPSITQWMARTGWTDQRHATHSAIADFINEELKASGGKALLLHWGGHGSVDRKKPLSYVFTSNAKGGAPNCICIEELLLSLADAEFGHLMQQVLIFDVCAAPFTQANDKVNPIPAKLLETDSRNVAVQQCPMYAASPGYRAENVSKRGAGLFSELLFAKIKAYDQPTLDQFAQAFKEVKAEDGSNGLRKQRPRMEYEIEGRRDTRSRHLRPDALPFALMDLIESLNISVDLARWVYLQSLPDVTRHRKANQIVDVLLDLNDMRPRTPSFPTPLIEFAERLGREINDDRPCTWARSNSDPAQFDALIRKLDAETQAKKPIATLFIQIDGPQATQFQWWIDAPAERDCTGVQSVPLDKGDLKVVFEQCASPVISAASAMTYASYELRIGFIVPAELFSAELDRISVKCKTDDPFVLNEEHAVVFHWYERILRQRDKALAKYQQVLKAVAPRIEQDPYVKVTWLDVPKSNAAVNRYARASNELIEGAEQAICLGIDHPFDGAEQSNLDTILACLKEGIPCLFWLQRPKSATKAKDSRSRVDLAFARNRPATAPVSLWKQSRIASQKEQIAPLRVVWDAPGFLPKIHASKQLLEDPQ